MDLRARFGRRLKKLRKLRNLTQSRLAELAGLSVQYVGRVERGRASPSFEVVEKLSRVLATEPSNLFLFDVPRPDTPDPPSGRVKPSCPGSFVTWIGTWRRDLETGLDHWSDSLYRLLGHEPGKVEPGIRTFLDHVAEDDRTRVAAAYERTLAGKSISDFAFGFVRGDGSLRRAAAHIDVTHGEDGPPVTVHAMILDVTEWGEFQEKLVADRDRLEERVAERTAHLVQARDEARQAAGEFQNLLGEMHEPFVRADVQGRVTMANKAAAALVGYESPSEVIGLPMADFYAHPEQRREFLARMRKSGPLENVPVSIRKRDGSVVETLCNARFLYDGAGHVAGAEGLLRDVTRLYRTQEEDSRILETSFDGFCVVDSGGTILRANRAETALREAEDTVRALLHATTELVFFLDSEGRVMECNSLLSERFGLTPEELRGRVIFDFFPPEVAAFRRERMEEAMRERRTVCFQDARDQMTIVTTIHPIQDEAGRVYRVAVMARDITRERRAQEELTESRRCFELAMEAVEDGLWDWDVDSDRAYFSQGWYAMLGYEPGEFEPCYETWLDLLHPGDRDRVVEIVKATIRHGERYDTEFRMRTRTGGWKWINARGRVMERDESGRALRLLGTHTDITERKEQERFQAEIEQIMQHDLKAPLSGILYLPRTILRDDNLNEAQRNLLEMVADSGRKMLQTINSFSTMRKVEAGTYAYSPEPFDLLGILDGVAGELRPLCREMGVDLVIDRDSLDPEDRRAIFVQGDAALARSVFSNLVKNAVEAAPGGTAVEVKLECGQSLDVAIRNQGAVAEPVRDRFFEKYATYGKPGGTGMGTYSARLMAELQGWDIAMSTSGDEGTVVFLSIPA